VTLHISIGVCIPEVLCCPSSGFVYTCDPVSCDACSATGAPVCDGFLVMLCRDGQYIDIIVYRDIESP